ncbi:hypothetical protein BT69DRAFT_1315306 [Atractiella rhizophila]|nr:hypothetical protein BT69DRAFT_1315306 [Atractiella rhizophila]
MTPKITLTYYDCQGVAESIRVLLKDSGVPFEDDRFYSREEFGKVKFDVTKFPFAKIPVLSYSKDDSSLPVLLCEANAIIHFLGQELGYIPTPLAYSQSLMLVSNLLDIRRSFSNWDDLAAWKAWFEGELRGYLDQLEVLTTHWNPDGTRYFFGTEKPVPGEFFFMEVISHWKKVYSKVLDHHPNLKALYEKLQNRERVQAYLNSPERPKKRSISDPAEGRVLPVLA